MQKEPILLILAAGMGSRYGGLKQIDPVGPSGEILMDYSIYDAIEAGFRRVTFIIGHRQEMLFHEVIGKRIEDHIEISYAEQRLDDLPEPIELPEERVKPWGTAHAILAARDSIDAPFAVINADDYYGKEAFHLVYNYLKNDSGPDEALMVNYILGNTLSSHGHVTRGICTINDAGYLESIEEHFKIKDGGESALFTTDDGKTWQELAKNSPCSMNFWGFHPQFILDIKEGFLPFLEAHLSENPLKLEYLLPSCVDLLINQNKLKVKCLESKAKWHGVTYREDRPILQEALKKMIREGKYPNNLWDDVQL